MSSPPPSGGRRWGTGVAIAALAAVAVLVIVFRPHAHPSPDFTLTDQHGHPFTLSAQRGREVVLYFGYTHCPDICPTTLANLAHGLRLLGPGAANVEVVFVTVDPQRDTVAAVGRYVRLFDPRFIGLTGTEQQLDPVYDHYSVFHENQPAGTGASGYLVAHSTTLYYIDPAGALRATGTWEDDAPTIAATLERYRS
jgi:protein SCO1